MTLARRCWTWPLLGLLLLPALLAPSPNPDWPAWIAGAHLSGDASRLYSFGESQRITREFAKPRDGVWAFVRPPVYATLLRPLAWFTPGHAFVLWQLLNLAALAGAVWLLWPSPWTPLAAVCFSPLLQSFKQGQDMPLLLLVVALSARLMRERPVLAGAVLALLGLKFHLLLLVPVFFVAKRTARFAAGFAAGGTALVAACFALYGASWPRLYVEFALENQRHLDAPAFDGSRLLLALALACALALLLRRIRDVETALFAALTVSVMAAPRLYVYDFALALPLLLVLLRSASVGV